MSDKRKKVVEELIEELDITGTAANRMTWLESLSKDLSKYPATKQAVVGGASGWVVGYISMKLGKMVATVVGSSMILMQLAAHQGYIKVNWSKVNKDLEKNTKKIGNEIKSRMNVDAAQSASDFAKENVVLTGSFAGGLLLGLASS